jgi:hypothetical protein
MSSFEQVKHVLFFDDWPCGKIYKKGVPMTPEKVAQARKCYIEWMQWPVNVGRYPRLLYALQLAEKAALDYQSRMCVGNLRSTEAMAIEMAQAVARFSAARHLPRLPASPPNVMPDCPPESAPDCVPYGLHTYAPVSGFAPVSGPGVELVFMGEVITPEPDQQRQEGDEKEQEVVDYTKNRGRVPEFPFKCDLTFHHEDGDVGIVDLATMEEVHLFPME